MDAMRKTCLYLAPAEDDPLRLRVSEMVAAALAPLGCDVVPGEPFALNELSMRQRLLSTLFVTNTSP